MSLKVGELWYELGIDARPFDKGIERAVKAAESRVGKLGDAAKTAGKDAATQLERSAGDFSSAGGKLADAAGGGLGGLSGRARKAGSDAAGGVAAAEGAFGAAGGKLADAAGGGLQRLTAVSGQVVGKVSAQFDALEKSASKWGPKATAAAAVAGAGLFKAAQNADQYATAARRIEGNLGDAAGEALTFVKNANRIGLSDRAAAGYVASLAEMQVGMGIAADKAGGLTLKTVELTAKLAALKGLSPEEGLDAIKSALIGEYDPLQKLVPTISAAAIEHRALGDSGKKSAEDLTAAEKAAATLNIVLEDASATIGRAGGEQATLALRTAKARSELDDLVTSIGVGAQPMIGFLADKVGAATAKFNELPDGVRGGLGAVAGIATVAAGAVGGLGMLVSQASKVRDAVTTVGGDGTRSLNTFGKAAGIAGAAGGVLTLVAALGEATRAAADFGPTAEAMLSGLNAGGTEQRRNITETLKQFDTLSGLWASNGAEAEAAMADITDLARTSPRDALAYLDQLEAGIDDYVASLVKSGKITASSADIEKGAMRGWIDTARDKVGATQRATAQVQKSKQADKEAQEQQDKTTDSYARAGDALKKYEADLKLWNSAADAAAAGAKVFGDAVEASTVKDDQIDAALQLGQAFAGFSKVDNLAALPKTIDRAKLAMGGYNAEQMSAIGSLLQLGQASTGFLQSMIEQQASMDEVNFAAAGLRDQYSKVFEQLGFTKEQTAQYLEVLGLTPPQVETAVKLSGDEEARFKIQAYQALIQSTPPDKLTEFYAKIAQGDYQGAFKELQNLATPRTVPFVPTLVVTPQLKTWFPGIDTWGVRRASGGPIPGTGNHDTVPAMLTPGEYVVRKTAAQRLGRHVLDELNATGRVPQQFSTGGPVTPLTPANLDDLPPLQDVLRAAAAQADADVDQAIRGRVTASGGREGGLLAAAGNVDTTGIEQRLDENTAAVRALAAMADRGDTFHIATPQPVNEMSKIVRRRRADRWLTTGQA